MGPPRRKRKPRSPAKTASRPHANPFIAPVVVELSRDLASGKQRATKKLTDGMRWELVPDELKPFIISRNLDHLESALRQRTRLYWHPVVRAQLAHLTRLVTLHPEAKDAPTDFIEVREHIERLVAAHAAAMVPGRQVAWEEPSKKSGSAAGLTNPYPRWPEFEWIGSRELDDAFQSLRRGAKEHQHDLGRLSRAKKDACDKLRDIVREVLIKAGPVWSGLATVKLEGPVPRDPRRRLGWFVETSREEWSTDAIDRIGAIVVENRGAFDGCRDGRLAFLARAILAVLLDTTPSKIRNRVEAYRKAHPDYP